MDHLLGTLPSTVCRNCYLSSLRKRKFDNENLEETDGSQAIKERDTKRAKIERLSLQLCGSLIESPLSTDAAGIGELPNQEVHASDLQEPSVWDISMSAFDGETAEFYSPFDDYNYYF